MNKRFFFLLCAVLFSVSPLMAQSAEADSWITYGMVIAVVLLILAVIIVIAESLLRVEASRMGVDKQVRDISIFPGLRSLFIVKKPKRAGDLPYHKLEKGYNLNLKGRPTLEKRTIHTSRYAVQPPNFRGIAPIPKVVVEEGEMVAAGDILFYDKKCPDFKFASPVSGEILEIKRGEKRSIAEVIILADRETRYRDLPVFNITDAFSREELVEYLCNVGFWPFLNRRPFDTIPGTDKVPRDIFISTFDTSPMAPDLGYMIQGAEEYFQTGLNTLESLTEGNVYLGLDGRKGKKIPMAFTNAYNVEKHYFDGPHPAGNVGVQIHHIKPISPGDHVWTLNALDVVFLGRLIETGRYDARTTVALCGSTLKEPVYIDTYKGANITELVKENLNTADAEELRFISGNVLAGEAKERDGYLNSRDYMLTVVDEGNYHEALGWLFPHAIRPSVHRSLPGGILPSLQYTADTNTHGERRAFVMTGLYEELLPMDIYPLHLMKAIMVNDFEKMEGLGIYELSEEDVALCEFACVSKQPLQRILREGLNIMQEQAV